MEISQIINKLVRLEDRVGLNELKAFRLICSILDQADIPYEVQSFASKTPVYKSASLVVDGESIACLPTGLKSGVILDNYNLISSLTSSQNFIDLPNINFNPKSDAICRCNFYFAPSLAISRLDIGKVMAGKNIKGQVQVKAQSYTAYNILVGNRVNPHTVVFAHYDAYSQGATDNASGVAVSIKSILEARNKLKNNLFVIAGNEELSYDYPIYWGRCFREFNRVYPSLLNQAKAVLVIDSVGDGPPILENSNKLIKLAFPINPSTKIIEKTSVLTGDFDKLMEVYHSSADTSDRLDNNYLKATVEQINKILT